MSDIAKRLANLPGRIYADAVASSPELQRGMVWCTKCGRVEKVDSAHCLRHGWPKCCGYTMRLGTPPATVEAPAHE